jgi:hypothetical protein
LRLRAGHEGGRERLDELDGGADQLPADDFGRWRRRAVRDEREHVVDVELAGNGLRLLAQRSHPSSCSCPGAGRATGDMRVRDQCSTSSSTRALRSRAWRSSGATVSRPARRLPVTRVEQPSAAVNQHQVTGRDHAGGPCSSTSRLTTPARPSTVRP